MKSRYYLFVVTLTFCSHFSAHSGETWNNVRKPSANLVLGQVDFTSLNSGLPANPTGLVNPIDIAIDPTTGKVFVSDPSLNRIVRFPDRDSLANGNAAEAVLGQPNLTTSEFPADPPTASSLSEPNGIVVDGNGSLWVADKSNNRVLRFDNASSKANNAPADAVYGQANFTSNTPATTASGMSNPRDVAVDSAGRLWVGDGFNRRVLRFDDAVADPSGTAVADGVLGQADFTSAVLGVSASGIGSAFSVAISSDGRTLWVCDPGANRILRFDNAPAKANGGAADGVLGQSDFTSTASGQTAQNLWGPKMIHLDGEGALWVVEQINNRVLRFGNAAALPNGSPADGVIGQLDFTSDAEGLDESSLHQPHGVFVDAERNLWVADNVQRRVLRYPIPNYRPDALVGAKAGAQRGDGVYNGNGAGQTASIKMKGNRKGKAFFTLQNDGNSSDIFRATATKGNRKLKVKYIATPGGNVTSGLVAGGRIFNGQAPGSAVAVKALVKGTRKARGKNARRNLLMRVATTTDGDADLVKAKVKKRK